MMKGSRRNFLVSALSGGVAATLPLLASAAVRKPSSTIRLDELEARYAKLDEALKQPVFKRELFPAPSSSRHSSCSTIRIPTFAACGQTMALKASPSAIPLRCRCSTDLRQANSTVFYR